MVGRWENAPVPQRQLEFASVTPGGAPWRGTVGPGRLLGAVQGATCLYYLPFGCSSCVSPLEQRLCPQTAPRSPPDLASTCLFWRGCESSARPLSHHLWLWKVCPRKVTPKSRSPSSLSRSSLALWPDAYLLCSLFFSDTHFFLLVWMSKLSLDASSLYLTNKHLVKVELHRSTKPGRRFCACMKGSWPFSV